jgi:hypothetical protein
VEVSQHADPMEAAENAGAELVENPNAKVRVIHDYELWVEWEEQPTTVNDWSQAVSLTISPSESVVLQSSSTVTLNIVST